LSVLGAAPVGEAWSSPRGQRDYASQIQEEGRPAVNAARSPDAELISLADDVIVDICSSRHVDFKPESPTINIYGELSPTAKL
jgi:hypothetical protein